jgi:hypothetical protein
VQPDIAEHMRHQARGLEDFFKGRVADAWAPGIGAERRHHGALAVAGKTAPLHRTAAGRHPRRGMQMTGDFADRAAGKALCTPVARNEGRKHAHYHERIAGGEPGADALYPLYDLLLDQGFLGEYPAGETIRRT